MTVECPTVSTISVVETVSKKGEGRDIEEKMKKRQVAERHIRE